MKKSLLPLIVLGSAVAFLFLQEPPVASVQSTAPLGEDIVSLRVRFGDADKEPRQWKGSVSVTSGELVDVRNWRPRPGDQVTKPDFSLATRPGINFVKRAWETPYPEPQRPYLLTPGLIVDAKGASSRLEIRAANGESYSGAASDAKLGRRLQAKGFAVERIPYAQQVSDSSADADFATILAHPSGEIWTAWTAFDGQKNAVIARRFDGKSWLAPQTVSGDHSDVHMVKTARDKSGRVWFAWASQIGSNFDIYARAWDGRSWSSIERLSDDPQPDAYPVAASDSAGNVWIAWQGYRNGKSDIFARRWDGARWNAAEKISSSPANDWQPAIAADSQGRVYIAWDTYDQGNYDILLRKFENGRWSEALAVAATGRYEAYPSIACDSQNRLWAAWNETGFEWGKDTGFLLKIEGTRLYQDRAMRVAVFDGGEWKSPPDINKALPEESAGFNDLPVLHDDGAGHMWLFFRHRTNRIRDVPSDTPNHRAAWEINGVYLDGGKWSEPMQFPFSASRQDVRTGFSTGAPGAVFAAYPTDRRDFEDFLYQKTAVYAARVPRIESAAAPVLTPREFLPQRSFPIHPDEARDLAEIRATSWEVSGKTYKIYRGDTHRHTEFSMDGNNDGSLLDTYRYAIDAAQLDYLMVSEHNGNSGPDELYPRFLLNQMVDLFHLPGTFVPIYGYERSVSYPNGHRNVLFAKRGVPTLPITAAEQKGKKGAADLYRYLRQNNGIAISHTSASNMGTDWRDNDPEVEPLVEIYQGDRVSNEYEGAPKAAFTANLNSAPGGFRPAGYVWNAWAKGYKLGIQASSDHLSTHISYACTISPEFTRQGLIDAMKLRHSYGATDNIVLDYRLAMGGREFLQGEIVPQSGPAQLVVNVKGTKPIRQIDIVRGDPTPRFIHNRQPMDQQTAFRYTDADPITRETYYYVRVIQVDDQIAWSSPIWIQPSRP